MTAEEILIYITKLLINYLDELNEIPRNDFIHGEMTAYIETLEIVQNWEKSKLYDLDFDVERKYKI